MSLDSFVPCNFSFTFILKKKKHEMKTSTKLTDFNISEQIHHNFLILNEKNKASKSVP